MPQLLRMHCSVRLGNQSVIVEVSTCDFSEAEKKVKEQEPDAGPITFIKIVGVELRAHERPPDDVVRGTIDSARLSEVPERSQGE